MGLTPFYSSIIGCTLLAPGIGMGLTNYAMSLRFIHLSIAKIFLIMTPLMIPVHIHRFYSKGPYDRIAWIHFIIFVVLLYISVRMFRSWYFKKTSTDHDH
jgi:hypothetical protein